MKRASVNLKKIQMSQTQMLTMFQMIIDNLMNNSQINLILKMRKKKNIIRNLNNLMSIHNKRKKLLSLILVWKSIKIKILRLKQNEIKNIINLRHNYKMKFNKINTKMKLSQ